MPRDDLQFQSAKRAYKQATIEGNRQEEARWANVLGDILKRRGEYVEALRWLRRDYEVSMKYLPEKQLLPTCQSLGEVYLRLQQFKDALIYQKKHLELAKDKDDLIEQQRASTQLGRTYHEMFSISESDHYAVRNAKKYFKLAMELTRTLKENSHHYKSSFTKEFVDAHNNLGMLEIDLDNLDEAEKILLEGLRICDEEEVNQDDDARSRLHHNLGSLYIELRAWDKAKEHIERDIIICNRIGHLQGEAKGYINLGELHYRVQKYDEAKLCYRKALDIARCMEDEDALVDQINQNIETVKEAGKVLEDLKIEEQRLKKLSRRTALAKGKPGERRCLLDQNASLDCLIEKASVVFAWLKHHEFAKRKKRVASDLCDKEKLSDSFLAIGESYQKLRNFDKARKWYVKSWNMYKLIGNLEGQALTKINIGEVLDSGGDWAGALKAFEEGYRLAVEGNLPSVQVSALDNMHYSHMIRFDNIEEARKLQQEIQNLKSSLNQDAMLRNRASECCSETDTEGDNISDNASDSCNYPTTATLNPLPSDKELSDDVPLVSLIDKNKKSFNKRMSTVDSHGGKTCESSKATASCSDINNPQLVGRKRVRVVLSDDEIDEDDETNHPSRGPQNLPLRGSVPYGKSRDVLIGRSSKIEDVSHGVEPKDGRSAFTQSNPEESSCSYKSVCPEYTAENSMEFRSSNNGDMAHASLGASRTDGLLISNIKQQIGNIVTSHMGTCEGALQCKVTFKIGDDTISVDLRSCVIGDEISIEAMKAELACLYYLQLSEERRSKGVLPIIKKLRCGEKALGSFESVEDFKEYVSGKGCIEVPIDGWVHNRLIKLYIDYCKKLSEPPSMKLLKRLYSLEFSEDEVILSDCELQDMSISPFLDALHEHNTISVLDISHNLLGNGTMEKLQQIFASSSQKYGGLTLDFHCNRFGPAALFQICECPVLFARLEVLNLSENRLTDACSSYLSTILRNCETLYSLKIEHCSITSRTIQKVADALEAGSVLSELSIGRNNPISGPAMVSLLTKLATLKRFSELNLNGVTLSKPVVDSLCRLSKSSSLSGLMLGSTNIGADGLVQLIQALSCGPGELVKLDISHCGLTSPGFMRMCADMVSLASLLELNLGRNSIGEEGCRGLISILTNPQCCLKVLILNKCQLGLTGIFQIIHALTENDSLEELNLAENTGAGQVSRWQHHITPLASTRPPQICAPEGVETSQQGLNLLASDGNSLEVADSEDNSIREAPTVSDLKDDCASSGQRSGFEECQLFQELSAAIGMAKQLQLLDLSNNGFSVKVAETFYSAWCSSSRSGGSSQKHITEKIIHFSVEGRKCCGVKSCCRRE